MWKQTAAMLERKESLVKLLPPAEAATWPLNILGKQGTIEKLRQLTGLRDNTLGRYLTMLHDEGRARIGRWHRTAGCPAAVWVQGPGEHAEKPKAFEDKNLYSQAHRKRVRKAIEKARKGKKYDVRYSKQVGAALASDTVKETAVKPVTWMSALGV